MSERILTETNKPTLSPWAVRILESDLFLALKFALFACVFASLVLWLLGNSLTTIIQACALLTALSFGLLALPDLFLILSKNLRGIAAILQAQAELATNRDWNQSGQIGDIIELEPEVKEVIRLVPTNQKQKMVQAPNGTELPVDDFVEFVRGLEQRGITRSKWVSESGKKPSYKFAGGREMDRTFYDAACEILEKRVRCLHNRRQGSSGTLTKTSVEILNVLGLE